MRMSTETDDPEVALAIRHAFASEHPTRTHLDVFYEHGQHYVTDLGTGKVWSVLDVIPGTSFTFEVISQGDETL